MKIELNRTTRIDMSAAAVTARIRRAGNLGEMERMATSIRALVAEIHGEKEIPELPWWQLDKASKRVQ